MIWVWIGIGMVAGPIAWFIFKAMLGFLLPSNYTGLLMLQQELKRHDIDPFGLPPAFLKEVVARDLEGARVMKRVDGGFLSNHFVPALEYSAASIAEMLSGRVWPSEFDPLYQLLKKHNLLGNLPR